MLQWDVYFVLAFSNEVSFMLLDNWEKQHGEELYYHCIHFHRYSQFSLPTEGCREHL